MYTDPFYRRYRGVGVTFRPELLPSRMESRGKLFAIWLQFYTHLFSQVDGYYEHSFEIWLACTVVFPGSGNIGFTLLEYRLGLRNLLDSLLENFTWVPFLYASLPLAPHALHSSEALTSPHRQLFLLRRAQYPPVPGAARAPLLVQHHMGRDQEGGRAVELLAGGPQDPQALLALARHQHSVLRRDGRPRHGRSPRRLAHLRLGLGRYRAARVSRPCFCVLPRPVDSVLTKPGHSIVAGCHIAYPVRDD